MFNIGDRYKILKTDGYFDPSDIGKVYPVADIRKAGGELLSVDGAVGYLDVPCDARPTCILIITESDVDNNIVAKV